MGKAMPAPKNPPFAKALGERIELAWKGAGFESRKAMCEASGLRDYSQLSQWATGKAVPRLESLMEIARVCHVSLHWLAFDERQDPATFTKWLAGPGAGASADARSFLLSLPLNGALVDERFYSVALAAWAKKATAEDAVLAAQQDRVSRAQQKY